LFRRHQKLESRRGNPALREWTIGYVNGTPLQFALRELQRAYTSRRGLAVMAVLALLLGLAGPFGSFTGLPFGARLAYWGAVVCVTYGLGLFCGMVVLFYLRPRLNSRLLTVVLVGCIASLPVSAAVIALGLIFIGGGLPAAGEMGRQFLYCLIATLGVAGVLILVDTPATAPEAAEAPKGPAILKRLPLAQRGRLLHLSMQDHYVEVVTDKGQALVLMRFSDAIAETAPAAGLQIHRSHWVALEAIKRSGRSEGRGFVELSDNVRLPISRGFADQARAAGLLV
jgi:hypothetical protein